MRRVILLVAALAMPAALLSWGASGSAWAVTNTKCSAFSGNFVLAEESLGGCTDIANTGGSGTLGADVIPPGKATGVLISWASGGTTTVTIKFATVTTDETDPAPCPTGTTEFQVGGQVTGSTGVGSSVTGRLKGEICEDANHAFTLEPGTKLKFTT
jgi:hypothetical protein